jgi:hypothetical protein
LRQLLGRKLSRRATTMNGSYRPQSAREPPGGKPPNLSREGATRRRAAFGVPKRRGQRPILGALQTGSSRPEQSSSSWVGTGKAACGSIAWKAAGCRPLGRNDGCRPSSNHWRGPLD